MSSSLKNIQQDYVELVLSHFVEERKGFRGTERVQLPPNLYMPGRGRPRDLVEFRVANFLDDLTSFWEQRWSELRSAVESTEGLCIAVWGDMGIEDILPKYSLYFDTIAVADPVLYVSKEALAYRGVLERYFQEFVTWAAIIEEIRPAILADTDRPLALIFPQQYSLSSPTKEEVSAFFHKATTLAGRFLQDAFHTKDAHMSPEAFEEEIRSRNSAQLSRETDFKKLVEVLLPLLDILDHLPAAKVKGFDRELLQRVREGCIKRGDAALIYTTCASLFYLLETRAGNAQSMNIDTSVSEVLYPFMLAKHRIVSDSFKKSAGLNEEDVVAYSFAHHFKWLDNLSADDAVRIRQSGAFQEIRELFRLGRRHLRHATIQDFVEIARELDQNVCGAIESEIRSQDEILETLRKRTRNTLLSFGTSAVLGLASLAFPELLPLSIGAAGYGTLLGGASLKDVVNQHLTGKKKVKELGERPVSFLIGAYRAARKTDEAP